MYRPNGFFAQHPLAWLVLAIASVVALFAWKGCQHTNGPKNVEQIEIPQFPGK